MLASNSMPSIKRKKFEMILESVDPFEKPKAKLEQYNTSAELAASILYDGQTRDDSISGKVVADLGCGTGMFSIGALILDAAFCVGFDIDPDAMDVAKRNLIDMDLEDCPIDLVLADVTKLAELNCGRWWKAFDTVVMNPPFGTAANNEGLDMLFLQTALNLARSHVYSLHKSSTKEYILGKVVSWGAQVEEVAELRFNIPNMYSRHKKTSVDIDVVLIHAWFPT